MSRLLGHLGGQQPQTIFSVIFGSFATNEKITFSNFQKKNFFTPPYYSGRQPFSHSGPV